MRRVGGYLQNQTNASIVYCFLTISPSSANHTKLSTVTMQCASWFLNSMYTIYFHLSTVNHILFFFFYRLSGYDWGRHLTCPGYRLVNDSELIRESTQNQTIFRWVVSWFESLHRGTWWVMSWFESIKFSIMSHLMNRFKISDSNKESTQKKFESFTSHHQHPNNQC